MCGVVFSRCNASPEFVNVALEKHTERRTICKAMSSQIGKNKTLGNVFGSVWFV